MIVSIYIGSDKLELFGDENINVKSSVAKIEDITKVFTDVSNGFTVPASDVNNAIFKHYYNANIDNSFDARKKVDGVIELSGSDWKFGKFKLNKVEMKGNNPSSYTITFFGNLVALKDTFKDDKLSDLDLSAYDFDFTFDNALIKNAINTDIVNTLLSNVRYVYDSSATTTTTDTLTNIYYNGIDGNSGVNWYDMKYSLKCLRIIEAIETKYSIVFSRDFFGGNEFSNLFILLNGFGAENLFKQQVVFDVFTGDPTLENDRILLSSTLPFSPTSFIQVSIDLAFDNTGSFDSVVKSNGIEVHRISGQGRSSDGLFVYFINNSDVNFTSNDNLTFHIESNREITYKYTVDRLSLGVPYKSERGTGIILSEYVVNENIPELNIIDFLKSLFKTYKLVAIPEADGSIYIDSLTNFYRKGKVYDITEYIDFSKYTVSSGVSLNQINYKFKESQTILATEFRKNNNDVDYGSLELIIKDELGDTIDGTELKYEVGFENMVYERVLDTQGIDTVNIQTGLLTNEELTPVTLKPHLHYVNSVDLGLSGFKVINQNGVGIKVLGISNMVAHTLGFTSPVFSTVFGEEFNEWDGSLISSTIYSNHHQNYIENIFNVRRRNYSFTAKNMPIGILTNLNLNDVIEIKTDYYRIDSYDINLTTKEVTFNLLNAINLDLTPIFSVSWDRTDITWDSTEITWDNI